MMQFKRVTDLARFPVKGSNDFISDVYPSIAALPAH
jgi:hypothetical protein